MRHIPVIVLFCVLAVFPPGYSTAAEGHHPHHVAIGYGYARHGSKDSDFVGVDYVYTFPSNITVGGYYEDVRGEFNIQAFGIEFGKKYASGFKFSFGPGVETKLKDDKNLLLFRTKVGFDWHHNRFSYGPFVSYDLIEDATDTLYLGVAVGYGF